MEISLKKAFQIAVEVHGEQRDKAGDPYLCHVFRVMNQMDTDEERAVAILHDTIEDAGDRAIAIGHTIYEAYGVKIGDAIVALTKQISDFALDISATRNETYMNYIRRVSTNPQAAKVKLADLRDNLDPKRLAKLPTEEMRRLIAKYTEAFRFLKPDPPPEEDMHE